MLSNKKTEEKPCNSIDTLIGSKTELKGDLVFTGGLRVDGRVRGNITAQGDGSSMVVVSEQGSVDGSIDVPHIAINGVVNGNLKSSVAVELQANARISGDVTYKTLRMELGAVVNGKLVCETAPAAGSASDPTPLSVASSQ